MNFQDNMRDLGSFVCGNKMRVSDPCYEPEIWCAGTLDAVAGTWECGCLEFDGAVAVLAARHESCDLPLNASTVNHGADARLEESEQNWAVPKFRVCVDSGQAGLFDDACYAARGGKADETWYKAVCKVTETPAKGGVLGDCVVSRAGYGDGGYVCVYHKNKNGLANFVFLMFMDDEGNEDW